MHVNQNTVDLFLNQVFASDAIKKACNILLRKSYDKNTIESALQFGLVSTFDTFQLYRNNQLQDLSNAAGNLLNSSKLYRERIESAMQLLDEEKELVPFLNFGELEQKMREFKKIVIMNYAPMECRENATDEEREAHNLMLKTNCCVRFLKEILPGMLDTLNGHDDPWCERKELLFVDLCCLAFDNPGFKRSGYYLKLTDLCSKLNIELNQFFLINIVSIWMAVLMANLDGNDAIKILVAGSYAKKHAFKFGTDTSVLESELVKVYCCAHPTVYYSYAVKTYQPARLEQENVAICGFYLELERILDIVRQYGFKNRLFSPEDLEKLKEIMETNLAKGRAEWHRILMAIAANTANEKERKSYDRFIAGCVKGGKAGGKAAGMVAAAKLKRILEAVRTKTASDQDRESYDRFIARCVNGGETRAANLKRIREAVKTKTASDQDKEYYDRVISGCVKGGLASAAKLGYTSVFHTPLMMTMMKNVNVDELAERHKKERVMVRLNWLKTITHLEEEQKNVLEKWFIGRKDEGENEIKWDNNLALLIDYQQAYGDTCVKGRHNKKLYGWVNYQRRTQRDPKKKEILDRIGFWWGGNV